MLFRSDRKSTRLNSSHTIISYAVFCLKKKVENRSPRRHELPFCGTQDPKNRPSPYTRPVPFAASPVGVMPLRAGRHNYNFFFNDTATTEIYTLSLHDALPI